MTDEPGKEMDALFDVHHEPAPMYPQIRGWYWREVADECNHENCHGPYDSRREATESARAALAAKKVGE